MFAPSSSMEVTVRSRYPPGCCQPQMPAPEISPSNLSWNFHQVVENPEDKPVCWVAGLRDWTGPSMATWLWFSMVLRLLMVSLGREAGREGVAERTQHCQTTQPRFTGRVSLLNYNYLRDPTCLTKWWQSTIYSTQPTWPRWNGLLQVTKYRKH